MTCKDCIHNEVCYCYLITYTDNNPICCNYKDKSRFIELPCKNHLEKEPSRFQRFKETHPRQYEYCLGGGEYDENGIWKPNKDGLGMRHVFDELNKIYGEGFIKY